MEIKIQIIIDAYKEEVARLTNDNILLKAQIKQLQNELYSNKEEEDEIQ